MARAPASCVYLSDFLSSSRRSEFSLALSSLDSETSAKLLERN